MPSEDTLCLAEEKTHGKQDIQYKSFRDTYKIVTFAMGMGLIYPDTKTPARRLICILIAMLTITPMSSMIFLDMYKSLLERDVVNIIRHCTIVGPFMAIFFKMLLLLYMRNQAKHILEEINHDYASYNRLLRSYKIIVNSHIQNNLYYSEKCWAAIVVCCVGTFLIITTILNIYNFLFKDEPTKYMIHDTNKPFAPPEQRFESPYFEAMFVYQCYCAVFYIINFTGFDGFFGLVINHACLKIDLYCKAFKDAMRADDKKTKQNKIVGVIKEQIRTFMFVDLIQETFNIWLGLVLVATMIQICNCMYHIIEGYELDLRYIIFIAGTVLHIYVPCHYSAKLKYMSLETATKLYCGGWENVYDMDVRRSVLIIIMRAQVPLEITAFNLLVFDMDLFVSIMKTSYSMYTLLRS